MVPPTFLYLPIVGVMGSGRDSHEAAAQELGALVAELGCNLLTGGGAGAMHAVTRAFADHNRGPGRSLALLPRGLPNVAGADVSIDTGLVGSEFAGGCLVGHSRNHLNVRLSDVVVALPGGRGTQSELALAVQHRRPCLAFLRAPDDAIGTLRRDEDRLQPLGVPLAATVSVVRQFLQEHLPPAIAPVPERT